MSGVDSMKKGFLFTVLALVLISFIFVSVQLWAQTQQVQETRSANEFKLEGMRTSLQFLDDTTFERYANASAVYAIHKLGQELGKNPSNTKWGMEKDTCGGTFPDGTCNLNKTIFELMTYGNTSAYVHDNGATGYSFYQDGTNLTYDDAEQVYILDHFFNSTQDAAEVVGYNLTWGTPRNFLFNQTDTWELSVYFEVPVILISRSEEIKIQRTLDANFTIDINGLPDPMLMKKDLVYRNVQPEEVAYRNVYHISDYEKPDDAAARQIPDSEVNIVAGTGWFFGPMTRARSSEFSNSFADRNLSMIHKYIFVTGDPTIASEESLKGFGAILFVKTDSTPQFNDVRTYNQTINGDKCKMTEWWENDCIYCLNFTTSNCSSYTPEATYFNTLANGSLPWASATIPSGSFENENHNYRLDAREILIKSDFDSVDDICPGDSPRCVGSELRDLVAKYRDRPVGTTPSLPSATDYSDMQMWDLTGPRDMAICAYYVKSGCGPSYTQRFLDDRFEPISSCRPTGLPSGHSSLGFGIETFALGSWVMGHEDPHNEDAIYRSNQQIARLEGNSQLGYHFYSGLLSPSYTVGGNPPDACVGTFYYGMPGCKNEEMCKNSSLVREEGVGRFALTNDAQNPSDRYGLDELDYDRFSPPDPFTGGYGTADCR